MFVFSVEIKLLFRCDFNAQCTMLGVCDVCTQNFTARFYAPKHTMNLGVAKDPYSRRRSAVAKQAEKLVILYFCKKRVPGLGRA